MEVNLSNKKNAFRVRSAILAVFLVLLLLAFPVRFVSAATPVVIPAIDGDGTLTVKPTSAVYSTATTFTFTFTANSGDFAAGSQAVIAIPGGWTSPSNSGAGRVILASHNCTLRSPGAEIAGFTSSTVSVDFGCAQGETFTVTYSDAKPYKVAGSPYTFTTTTEVPGGVAPAEIAVSPTVEVTPKAVTVSSTALTADNKVYDGTTDATFTAGDLSLTGVVPGDVVSLNISGATGTFSDKHVGTSKAVTVSGLFLTGADTSSYTLTQPTLSANITSKPITVTAVTDSKVYDGSVSSSGLPVLSPGTPLAPGDSEPVWTQTFGDKNAGTGKSLIPAGGVIDGNGGANYAYSFVPDTTGVITARPITVTAIPKTKVVGAPDPLFKYKVNPALFAGDGFSGALTRTPGELPGRYDILQGTLSAGGNYAITYTGAKLTITKERTRNGGFNTYVGTSKIPRYWTAAGFKPTDGKSSTKKEGTASVKLGGAPAVTKSMTQTLTLSGVSGDPFTFSFWIKGASVPATGICRAQVLLYNGTTLKATKTVNCDKGTYGFRQKKVTFIATSAYTKVKITFTYAKNSGTVWFDAASLLK